MCLPSAVSKNECLHKKSLHTHPISLCTKTIIHSFCKDCEFRISFAMSCFTSPLPTIHIAPLQSQSSLQRLDIDINDTGVKQAEAVFFLRNTRNSHESFGFVFLPRSLVVKILLIKPNVLQKTHCIFQTKKLLKANVLLCFWLGIDLSRIWSCRVWRVH